MHINKYCHVVLSVCVGMGRGGGITERYVIFCFSVTESYKGWVGRRRKMPAIGGRVAVTNYSL